MKKLKTLDKYVIFSITMLILFTIAEFALSGQTGTHDQLTICFFSCFGGEILSCCLLKLLKIHKGDDHVDVDH